MEVNFSIRRGDSTPILFQPLQSDGTPWPLQFVDAASLNVRPLYGVPMKIPLQVDSDGLRGFLNPADTQDLVWQTADYDVSVIVKGVLKTVFSGKIKLIRDAAL